MSRQPPRFALLHGAVAMFAVLVAVGRHAAVPTVNANVESLLGDGEDLSTESLTDALATKIGCTVRIVPIESERVESGE